jgi:GntR family transcriptional regulator, transcriptional repressor for pyruvate dehydrogenase complex
MPIKHINKNNISNQIFEQIKSNIISGEWKPGDKIPSENELKEMLGVSRNSVRAALQQLTALGLITAKHGEGTFVNDLTPGIYMNSLIPMVMLGHDGLLEILEFRKIIEVESVKLAAQRATREEIEELEEVTSKMLLDKYNPKKFAEMDAHFHELLIGCSKNSILVKVNTIIGELLITNQIKIQELIGPTLARKYHPMILEYVKKKDSLLASKIMEEHICVTIDEVRRLGEAGRMEV